MHEGACETGSAYVLFTQARVRCDNNLQQIGLCHDYNMKKPWKKSTVLDGFFPYLAQMITSMKGCVANNDLWPWPIYSKLFGPGLENHVRSVASTVLDEFFPYLVQMITSIRRCVVCDDLWTWPISSRSFDIDFENRVQLFAIFSNFSAFTLKKNLQFCLHSFHIWHKSSLASEGVSHVMTCDLWPIFSRSFGLDLENRVCLVASTVLDGFFPYLVQMITSMRRCVDLDLYLQGHWTLTSKIVSFL